MNSYIARQPILDIDLRIYAYELLFRSNERTSSYESADSDKASLYTTMESFYTIGIESITNKKMAFINFTSQLLLEGVATLFPKDQLVIELLEDIEPTPEVIEACRKLSNDGYILAMDDFVYRPELDPLIKMSKIIKFDFISCSTRRISNMLKRIDTTGKQLLAEKIETVEMFEKAVSMGFTLFQGYFFCKPVTMTAKRLEPLKVSYISLIRELGAEDEVDYGKLAEIVRSDLALCHKLLRMVNSVYYGLLTTVTDIRHALVIHGMKEIRKWIYVTAMMDLCANKPDELVKTSMIRGFFMEQISIICSRAYSQENLFLLGIFSLIDVLMEQPMHIALNGLKLSPGINEALILNKGKYHNFLLLVISIENGNWDETDRLSLVLGVTTPQISEAYLKSVKWCDEILT